MPHTSATRQRAGVPAVSGPAARRRPLSNVERLHELSMRLDELIRDVSFTPQPRSHHEVERRIAEAEEIAGDLRAMFRSTSNENAPLKRVGTGAWW